MEYKDNFSLDASQVDGSGSGRGGVVAVGGIGGILITLLAIFLGINPGQILGQTQAPPPPGQSQQDAYQECNNTDKLKTDSKCRLVVYTQAVQSYWSSVVQGYPKTQTKSFSGSIQTACGTANSSVGPFYCPGDQFVYIDMSFLQQMMQQLGAQGGEAAELYVIAHEYGHHIQNVTGAMSKAQQYRSQQGPEGASVRLELQADCYAGAFLQGTLKDANSPIKSISKEDFLRAMDAAKAVGDDRIQQQTQGRIDRESWTHGSAKMRQQWLLTGIQKGPNSCNTFDPNATVAG